MGFRCAFFMLFFTTVISSVYCQNNSTNCTSSSGSSTPQTGISQKFLFKCHGVLMTFSWLFFAPCAILYTRFLRDPLIRVLGEQLWFQVHRLLNTLTFICVLIAFICVLSSTGGEWSGPTIYKSRDENFSWASLHSLFGLVAFLLTMFQPVSTLFRCQPDSPARMVFNVLHAFTGYFGWLSALITICIACVHFRLFASPMAATVLIIVFLVLLALVALLMQIVAIRKNQQGTEWIGQTQLFITFTVIFAAIAVAISLLIIFT